MSRDDDDRPRKKRALEEDDDEDEVEVDEDRPRKKSPRAEDDLGKPSIKPMPTRLAGAIIAALAWGFLSLHGSCLQSSNGILQEVELQKLQRDQEENRRKFQEQMRAMGVNQKIDNPAFEFGGGNGLRYTVLGTQIFLMLTSAALVGGGVLLLMRLGFGKYIAMGAPVGMLLVELSGFVICLIITKGTFLAHYNVGFLVNIFFSILVGGTIVYLLLNKDVSKALK
jgi:hypothetical protein